MTSDHRYGTSRFASAIMLATFSDKEDLARAIGVALGCRIHDHRFMILTRYGSNFTMRCSASMLGCVMRHGLEPVSVETMPRDS